jgi:hypothetical protein
LVGGHDGPIVLFEAAVLGVDVGHASGDALFDGRRKA